MCGCVCGSIISLTGESSMHTLFTGPSNRSKHCSPTNADTVAPTPPDRGDSSSKISLCVRSREAAKVPMSNG